jgi:hypothetical protein
MAEEEDLMTEDDWLGADSALELLDSVLLDNASGRKLRLFACACCRRIWRLLHDDRVRRAVEFAEKHADGEASEEQLEHALDAALEVHSGTENDAVDKAATAAVFCANRSPNCASEAAECALDATTYDSDELEKENEVQAQLLRDIFGNPFRPATLNPAWRTSNVAALAQAIYADRAFDRLPILADALEDSGCDNADILNHCRQRGEHVRGCWVVDLVLAKE